MSNQIEYLVLKKQAVQGDWKLHLAPRTQNNGRKVLVSEVYPAREYLAHDPEWKPGSPQDKTPVVETGYGGVEVATFTDEAGQDCHKHLIGTEIYTVLEGKMTIRLAEAELELEQGDEVIVFPDTPHEVLAKGTRFLARVHSINCQGDRDKYVLKNQQWCQALTLKRLEPRGAS
jgi:quercetin dioxygenase-like cupin family protein